MQPVNKKFIREFDEKPKNKSCFGFLRGRKVYKEQVVLSPIFRSRAIEDFRVANLEAVNKN